MAERVYHVVGMTCEHCANAVRTEVGAVAGVSSVDVELSSGRLAVGGAGFTDAQIAEAVDEAGYELANAGSV